MFLSNFLLSIYKYTDVLSVCACMFSCKMLFLKLRLNIEQLYMLEAINTLNLFKQLDARVHVILFPNLRYLVCLQFFSITKKFFSR